MRLAGVFGLGLLVFTAAQAQKFTFAPVSQEVVEQRLRTFVTKNSERGPAIERLFKDAGCDGAALTERPVKGSKYPNIVCSLTGGSETTILVGGHFDLVEQGSGVVDNWSGSALLASLYQGLAKDPRRHTIRFVAFTGEEQGMVGSRAYVKDAVKNNEPISAMVNLDTLGLTDSEVWVSRADKGLVESLSKAAFLLKLPVSGVNVEQVGSTDSEPFREKKIPALTIHSLTTPTLELLHGPKDKIEAINMEAYYKTYRLVLGFLALLDQELP